MIRDGWVYLVYEPITGQLFEETGEQLNEKLVDFNVMRLERRLENVCLNEWLTLLGLKTIASGDEIRWKAFDDIGYLDVGFELYDYDEVGYKVVQLRYWDKPTLLPKYSTIMRKIIAEST